MNKKIDTLIMKGKPVSDKIIEVLISRIEKLKIKSGRSPGLAVILVGEDPASQVYVRLKGKMADKVGIETYDYKLSSDISFEELEPRAFSFNSPFGACKSCEGLGTKVSIDPDLVVPNKKQTIVQGCIAPIGPQPRGNWYGSILKSLAKIYDFRFTTPWEKIDDKIQNILLYGTEPGEKFIMKFKYKNFTG